MFVTPPSRKIQTRSATLKMQREQTAADIKMESKREVQSENLELLRKNDIQQRQCNTVCGTGGKSVSSGKKSSSSMIARRKQLELEAAEAKARIDKDLIEKRLAAEVAALDDERSKKSCKSQSCANTNNKVEQWLESSRLDPPELPPPGGQLPEAAAVAAPTDIQLLACALKETLSTAVQEVKVNDRELLSRMSTSKDLPLFFGDPLEFLQFHKSYLESTKLCGYTDTENLWRLRKCLRGEARETVSSLLIGNTSPIDIIEALELRFGRPEVIMQKLVSQLKKIPNLPVTYHNEIVNFSIKIKNYVAAVLAVKQTDYLRSPEILTTVISKCPSTLISKWADYLFSHPNVNKAKLELFADFLHAEATKTAAAGISHIYSQTDFKKKHDDKRTFVHTTVQETATTAAPTPTQCHSVTPILCNFCRKSNHRLPDCAVFKKAMRRNRWHFVRVNKLCYKCLISRHSSTTCSAANCDVEGCNLPHHRLLHYNKQSVSKQENDTQSDSGDTVAHTATTSTGSNPRVLLKVVPITVHGPKGNVSTHALLDDGATVTLISADVAEQVGLQGETSTMCVKSAWDSAELVCTVEKVNFCISNLEGQCFNLKARKMSELNIPVQSMLNIRKYEHVRDICFADTYNCNIKPKLLIGQDNYNLIAPIQCISRRKNEPYVTQTSLGWCVHGIVCAVNGVNNKAQCKNDKKYLERDLCYNSATESKLQPLLPVQLAPLTSPLAPMSLARAPHAPAAAAFVAQQLATAPLRAATSTAGSALPPVSTTLTRSHPSLLCASTAVLHVHDYDTLFHEEMKRSFAIDAIGITNQPRLNADDVRAVAMLDRTAKLIDQQWEVGLPWKSDAKLPDSYPNAYRRLLSIERKMRIDESYAARYKERVKHLFVNNYAREVTEEVDAQRIWYLPHFGVDNPNKKKLRLVFDAAALSAGLSLNDHLLQGPDLLQSLMGIMMRFREHSVAVTGDIKDMFLRIKINLEDQHALRFLWRENSGDPVKEYVMSSLIFGANCSPFIAIYIKNKNAMRYESVMPDAVENILKNHYMDDCIDSFEDSKSAAKIISEVIHIQGGFETRNWTSNCTQFLENIPKEILKEGPIKFKMDKQPERTLGLMWDPNSDTLAFDIPLKKIPIDILTFVRKPTKREVLRFIMSIFDIYGMLAPFTIKGKILMQKIWQTNITWDQQITDELNIYFCEWLNQLKTMQDIRVARWYFRASAEGSNSNTQLSLAQATTLGHNVSQLELHVFCDASPAAYAAVAYYRKVSRNSDDICVSFTASKSRVAPVKSVSVPRLELQAALLGCRLADNIQREHRLKITKRYFWTDSTTVLHWIRNKRRTYKTFVANRLGEIDTLSKSNEWHFVPTDKNIADVATKRNNYELCNDCEWFTGPTFLSGTCEQWPSEPNTPQISISDEVLEAVHTVHFTLKKEDLTMPDPTRFSSRLRLKRSTAAVLLFIEKCRKNPKLKIIDRKLIDRAEVMLLKYSQNRSFHKEINYIKHNKNIERNSRLLTLTPVLCEDDLLRVDGRIGAAKNINTQVKNPVILDGRDHISRLIVKEYHERAAHSCNEMVVNELRQKYWILQLRPTVRTVAAKCLVCRLRKLTPKPSRLGNLPEGRLAHHQRPFSHCGIDLFGPYEVTIGRGKPKRYGVIFTCLTVRAVHIEIVDSLTSDSLIMALRRMAARRGWPQRIYSDNGTNLRGAETELKKAYSEILDKGCLQSEAVNRGVDWFFISPASPHMGGAWERLIRSIKNALRVVLKERAPREEVFSTLLAEIENMVNSRPLTHVSVDPTSQEALTPNHFLLGSSSNLPVPGVFSNDDFYLRRQWKIAQRLSDMFWQRWVKEVLPELLPRQKWCYDERPLNTGDLVVVTDPNLPRNSWPMGMVEHVYPGNDGRVRVVDIRTRKGVMKRPVTRVARLPVSDECRTSDTRAENVDDAPRSCL